MKKISYKTKSCFKLTAICVSVLMACGAQQVIANPLNPQVMSGQASFATAGNVMTVTNTPGAIINWSSFSIGKSETTRFAQQSAASSVLNRVTGVDPSSILGSLQSNGRVFLINPNGIVFGAGSTVDVAGMVASTLNLSNADFLAGRNHFTAIPNAGNLANAGNITTANAGHVYLIAPNVENTGVITSPNGEILLAAGSNVDLVNSASPNLRVNITAGAGNATNVGQLVASSGRLGLFGALVKNSGTVNADGVVVQGGEVIFKASSRAEVGGTVSANGTTGGTIQALGNEVGIMNGAAITANGTQGGGTILVGGDKQGLNPSVQNAQVTYVDPTAVISADGGVLPSPSGRVAGGEGNGGKIVVWADNTTRMYGKISARGGALSGNGGFVETSGKKVLDLTRTPDVFAPNGTSGVWLLDPETINIVATASVNSTGASPFSPLAAGTSSLQNTIVNAALNAGGIVTIDTTGGSVGGVGDINVNAVLSKTAGAASTLNFNAHGNVNVNSAISSTVGALNINFTPGQAGAAATTNVLANITPNGGVVTFNKASSLVSAVGFTLGGVGGGTFVNPLGATMTLSGTTFSGVTLNNNGTVNQTANVALTGSAIFNNNLGANYNLNTTAAQYLYANGAGTFNNAGTFTQVAATATNIYSGVYVGGAAGTLTFNEASTGILAGTGARINMAANLTMTGNLTLQGLGLGLAGNASSTYTTLAPTTMTGALTMLGAGNAPAMNLAGGNLTVAAGAGNTLTVTGGTITTGANRLIINGTAALSGVLPVDATLGAIDVSGTGTLNMTTSQINLGAGGLNLAAGSTFNPLNSSIVGVGAGQVGVVNASAGSIVTLNGPTLNNITFNNNTTVNQTGSVALTGGAIFNNNLGANYNLNTTAAQYLYANGAGTFNNAGTFTQVAATATNIYSGGYVPGVAGTLTFNEASTGILAGTGARINMAANLTMTGNLTLQGLGLGLAGNASSTYTTLAPTTMTGALTMLGAGNAPAMNLAGGNLTVAAGAGNTLTVTGGTITTGANRLIINGTAALSGVLPVDATLGAIDVSGTGTLNMTTSQINLGAGGLNLAAGSTFNPLNSSIVGVGAGQVGVVNASAGSIVTLNGPTLNNITFNNNTTVNQTGSVALTGGAIFNNNLGANYNLNTTAAQYLYANGAGTFNNAGTFTQVAATATNIYSGGYVPGVAGTLTFNEASTGILAGTGARINMAANLTMTGNLTLQGLGLGLAGNASSTYTTLAPTTMTGALTMLGAGSAPAMNLAGGSLTVAAGASNSLTVAGGTITTGANRLIVNGTAALSGVLPVDATLGAIDVSGTGTLNMTTSQINLGAGGLNLAAGSTFNPLNSSIVGVGAGQVGVVNASAGSIVTLTGPTLNNITFNNNTTVNQTGNVALTGGAIFNNNLGANYNLNTTAAQYLYANGAGTFNNAGTFTQVAATATNIYSGVYVGGAAGTLTFNEASTGILAGTGARINMAANLTMTGNLTLQGLGLGLAGNASSTYTTLAPTTMTGALTMLGAGSAPAMNLAGGSLTVAAGASNSLTVAGGTITTGANRLIVNGTAALSGVLPVDATLGAIDVSGTGVLNLNTTQINLGAGGLNLAAGSTFNPLNSTINGTGAGQVGVVNASAGAIVTLNGPTLNNITFNNNTTVNQTGNVLLTNGTIFNNNLGANYTLNTTAAQYLYASGAGTFNNAGTFTQVAATATNIYSGGYVPGVAGTLTFNEASTGILAGTGARINMAANLTTTGNLTLQGLGLGLGGNASSTYTTLAPTTVTGSLTVGSANVGPTVNLTAGALTNTGTMSVAGGTFTGLLNNQTTLTASNTPSFGDINNTGTLTAPSTLSMSGSFTQGGAGTLSVPLAGFTLNAGTDITLNNAITKPAGSGLWTFSAGRSVALNSSVTTNNSAFTAVANSGGLNNNGTATPATLTMGAGATINAGTGVVNLAVTGGNFFNNSGSATPIVAGNTRIYSTDPRLNNVGGMVTQSRLYLCTYVAGCGVTAIPAANTVYLYSIADPTPVLTITANALSKVYGTVDPTLTYSVAGLIGGDVASGVLSGGVSRVAGNNVGAYAITNAGLAASGYVLNYVGNNLTITAAPLTVAGTAVANKIYNGNTAATLSGGTLVGVLAADVASVTLAQSGTFATKNVGTNIVVTAADTLGGAAAGNYSLTQPAALAANITPAALNVTAAGVNRVYDATTAATVTLADNRIAGDVLTTAYTAAAFLDKNVAVGKAVNVSGISLAGADATNYTFNTTAATTANITQRPLTMTGLTVANKVYDGTVAATVTGGTYNNIIAGDVLTVGGLTASFADANAAVGKTVTVTGAASFTGADAGNYTITAAAPSTALANITPRPLTVLLGTTNRVYNGTIVANNSGSGATLQNVVAGENVGFSAGPLVPYQFNTGFGFTTLNALATPTTSFADKNVGVGKVITLDQPLNTLVAAYSSPGPIANSVNWGATGNYSFAAITNATGNITPLAVQLAGTRVYDSTLAANSAILNVANKVAGDVLTLSGGVTLARKAVGNQAVAANGTLGLAGVDAPNYTLTGSAGTVTITPASLTVSGNTAANKVYDGGTVATVNSAGAVYTGIFAGDVVTVSTAGTFADKNVAVGKTVSLSSTGSGADAGNYTIVNQAATTANITAKALTVGATGINKVYDATTAATVTLADNRIAGDVLTTAYTTAAFLDKNVGVGKTVNVAGITLAGVDSGNYSFNTTAATTANITAKALTVSGITAVNKVYDGTTAATINTAGAIYTGLIAGDVATASAAGATGSFVDKNVGINKGVSISGMTLTGVDALNYSFNTTAATTANITAKALTVAGITAANKVYDGTTAATVNVAGATYTGLVAGDVLAVNATGTFADKNVAAGKVVTLTSGYTGADAGNYTITNQGTTTANITGKTLTVAGITAANKVYDATTAATVNVAGAIYTGLVAGDVLAVNATGTFADKNVAAGKVVTLTSGYTGADAGNYLITNQGTTTANITAKALTVSGITAVNKVYDGTTAATINTAGAIYTGLIAGDVATASAAGATGSFVDKNVGINKGVSISGMTLTGVDALNYSFNATAATTANITGKTLTVAGITAANKVYDATTAATVNVAGATYTGLVAGDVLAVNATGTFADKNVAAGKVVTLTSGYTGADAGNYLITNQGTTTANITAKALTVGATGINKVYDATTAATVTLADNRIAGDVLTTAYTTAAFLDKNVGVGKTVNVAGITLAGVDSGNYSFNATAATTANITGKTLTVAGITAANKVYDATTAATVNVAGATYTGLVAGDVLAVNATGTFADKNVAAGKVVTLTSGYTGADAGNYLITNQGTTTANITAKALTVGATGINKVYDATTAATVTLADNRIAGDVLTTAYTTAAFLDKNVGVGKTVNVAGITLAGVDSGNYSFNATAATTANITGKTLTVAGITAANKVYDATTAATVNVAGATYTGLVAGDVLAVNATGTFADKNAAVGKLVTLTSGYTGADVGNYLITNQGTTTANITAKALTVGATGINKVYDATTAATVTLADNRIAGDVLTTGYTTAAFLDKNVGVGKTVNVAGISLAGVDALNYSFNATAATTANITAKALTVGATGINKVYDATTAATVTLADNRIAGDVLTTAYTTAAFLDKNVGVGKTVNVAGITLAGVDSGNYSFNATAATTANITGKALTIAGITAANKVYDATTAATVNVAGATYTGLVAGDVLAVNATGTFADKNVAAGKVVTLTSGYTGADAGNYLITNQGTTTANITAKALTVGATGINKVYDATTAATVTLADNRIAGDVLTTAYTTAAFLDKNVGVGKTVNVAGITLAGVDSGNYSFNATAATTANITAKALTVGATGINKVYDATTAATVTLADNRIAGDVLTTAYTTAAFLDKNVGVGKTVNVAGITLAGVDSGNYSFNATAATTANITGKTLTVAGITAANKVYDATTAATVSVAGATYTGLVAGDVLAVNATGTFADKNVAAGKVVTLTSGYTGADAGNYLITNQATTTANITAKALTVGATGINKVYDATTAATVTLADNRIAGDVLTTAYTTAAFLDKNVGVGKTVNVAGITLAGVDSGNYSFNTTAATTANITAKALTVGATGINKVYDATTAATVTLVDNRIAGDVLTTAYTTAAFLDKNVGVGKTVNVAGITLAGVDSGNYSFNATAATTANITGKTLTVAGITAANKVYDATTAATVNVAGATYTGLVAGDVLAVNATGTFADKNVAAGKVVTLTSGYTGADAGNYLITGQATTTANITAKALTVGATGINKVYDATTAATVTLADNRIAGDVLTTAYTTAAFLDKNVGVGKTVNVAGITLAGVDSGNYSFNTTAATTANITAKALTVGATGINKVYDATTAATVTLADNRIAGDVLTTAYTTAAFLDKNVGVGKTVNVAGITLAGVDSGNYSFNATAATTANITPASLAVAANAAGKVYGSVDPGFSYTATGLMAGDTAAIVLTGTLARIAGENVGAYAINQGTLAANANYTLGYTANNLTITPAALSVIANAQTKASGAIDPALTYVTTGFKFADTAATVLTGGLSRIAGEAAGAYAINQGLLASNANYTIAYTGNNLTINAAPVGAAVAPVDIVNTILIPGNTAPGTAHSTIQTANVLNSNPATPDTPDTVVQVDNANRAFSSAALVCRETGVPGQGLQAVPLCVMSVR